MAHDVSPVAIFLKFCHFDYMRGGLGSIVFVKAASNYQFAQQCTNYRLLWILITSSLLTSSAIFVVIILWMDFQCGLLLLIFITVQRISCISAGFKKSFS